ncbi:MAG: thiamine phosphate synthase [Elusimicrobiales bacterium]|nr:thiamine phosphate synthase [Elusimicrobiales bacterium]
MKTDYSLYLVADARYCLHHPIEKVVEQSVAAGVGIVQLRDKSLCDRDFMRLASRLQHILSKFDIPLIVNDRVAVAFAVAADGVHLGRNDMPPEHARRILGPKAIIGLSVETVEQAEKAALSCADYLAASPVFATPTKTDAPKPVGLEGLARMKTAAGGKPLAAIGGINRSNAAEALRHGADSLAVVSAICSAQDPAAAAADLRKIISGGRHDPTRIRL